MADRIVRAISTDGMVQAAAICSRDLTERARQIHKTLPVATVYVVFTGIGAVGTNLVDILVFREPVSVMKIVFIVLLIAGIIGLKLVTDKPEDSGVHDSVAVAAGCFAGGCSNDTDGCCVSHAGANAEVAALEAADSKQTGEVR